VSRASSPSINAKLGIHSRAETVERARALGLLASHTPTLTQVCRALA